MLDSSELEYMETFDFREIVVTDGHQLDESRFKENINTAQITKTWFHMNTSSE